MIFIQYYKCRSSSRTSTYRDIGNHVYASDVAKASVIKKEEKLEGRLGELYPTFVKLMLQSHTTGGFWLVSVMYNNE
jgi:hypothetical protein